MLATVEEKDFFQLLGSLKRATLRTVVYGDKDIG